MVRATLSPSGWLTSCGVRAAMKVLPQARPYAAGVGVGADDHGLASTRAAVGGHPASRHCVRRIVLTRPSRRIAPPSASTARGKPAGIAQGSMAPPRGSRQPPGLEVGAARCLHLLAREQPSAARRARSRSRPAASRPASASAEWAAVRMPRAARLAARCRSARSGPAPGRARRRWRRSAPPPRSMPKRRSISCGSCFSAATTWPLLRPDAPQPGSFASTTSTEPHRARARCSAADRPV